MASVDDYFTCSKHGETPEGVCAECEQAARIYKIVANGVQSRLTVKEILHELRGLGLPIDTQAIAQQLIGSGLPITKPFKE
jgi:hypothetical protein